MRTRSHRMRTAAGAAAILAVAGLVAAPARAEFTESFTLEGRTLVVQNLIGQVEIVAASGGSFQVEARAQGRDASRDNLTFEVVKSGPARLSVRFPEDERTFVYPPLGRGSRTTFSDNGSSSGWFSGWFGGGRTTVSGSGRGAEMWVDLTIRVPAGARLTVEHGVGQVHAQDLEAELDLDVKSGAVEVAGVRGPVVVDTGSGHVTADDVTGELTINTGSGHVTASRCRGDRVLIDTGSGTVELDGIVARKLSIDTGSGGIRGQGIEADDADIDTGSGGVELALARMGPGRFRIDTGSGGIRLSLPEDASAEVRAETGSGGITVDLPGANVVHQERDELELRIGDGAARMELSTGSGGIRIASHRR